MRLFLRLWLAVLVTAFPGWGDGPVYPGTPVLTSAGPLSCGVRMYAAGQAQAYCLYSLPPNPIVTVCNSISVMSSSGSLPTAASLFCMAEDAPNKLLYVVTWILQPMSDGTTQYQIAWNSMPCAPPVTAQPNPAPVVGGCVTTGGGQSASFQQGFLK